MSKTPTEKVKKGLGMICFGIIISFLMSLIFAIVQLVKKDGVPSGWNTANGIVSLISVLAVVGGVLVCFFSRQKYFKKALAIYILLLITMIVLAIFNEKLANHKWVLAIYYSLLALAHVFVILALKDVSNNSKFNSVILSLCILLFVTIIVFIILNAAITLKFNYVALINVLSSIESVLFFISIFTTYRAIQ